MHAGCLSSLAALLETKAIMQLYKLPSMFVVLSAACILQYHSLPVFSPCQPSLFVCHPI